MEDGETEPYDSQQRTFAQSCKTLLPNAIHLEKVQDAVVRMNKIRMLASELLTLHIQRCLNHSIPLPKFTQTWCKQLFKEVSRVTKGYERDTSQTDDAELTQTNHLYMKDIEKPSRSYMSQMLNGEAILLKTVIETNIKRHYKKRLLRFVRWTFHTSEVCVLSPEEYKTHKLNMLQITSDLCRSSSEPCTSPTCYHSWIDQYRKFFHLSTLLDTASFGDVTKNEPERLLPSMKLMNQAFEGSGMRTFSLLPLTRSIRPGFVDFEYTTWIEILSLPKPASRQEQIKASNAKKAKEVANGTYEPPKVRNKRNKEERERANEITKRQRAILLASETATEKKDRVAREKAAKVEHQRLRRLENQAKKASQAEERNTVFAGIFDIKIKPPRGYMFNFHVRTDGISARLLFGKDVVKKDSNDAQHKTPVRGLYAIDTIKHFSKLDPSNMQVIGIDPGVYDLIHAVSFDEMLNASQSTSLKYSSAQRRFERGSTVFAKKMHVEKPDTVVCAEKEMSKYNSRSCNMDTLMGYFAARRMYLRDLQDFYFAPRYRIRRWRSFKKDQRSLAMLVTNLKSMKEDGKTMILAYGAWVNVSSNAKRSGIAPCIGMGLRTYLSKHFIVVDTPEHYTSKTCSCCMGMCGPFKELDHQRREKKLTEAKNERETRKASRYTVRSIRRCQNVECGVVLHRDKNAARNIADNFLRLYAGKPPLKTLSREERKIEELMCSICL